MSLSVVVLAAGKSTRFKSETPKVLYPLGERPMLAHTLDLAMQVSGQRPVIVVGPETEDAIRAWGGDRARYVLQEERLGTGHAVLQARAMLEGTSEQVLVLYGDMPLLRAETLRDLRRHHERQGATVTLLTVVRDESQGFGRVVRDAQGLVEAIVEEVEATPEIAAIRELNTGVYIFDADVLWPTLDKIRPSPRKGEYYLTDMAELASQAGRAVAAMPVQDPSEVLGINTRADLAQALAAYRRRINHRWMLAGVTLVDPATTYIGPQVRIGQDTVIHPNTHLRGETAIGVACEIGPNTVIEQSIVGDRCAVLASVLEHAVMEEDSDIGPFSHLRKGARVGAGAHVGNFGEMKNSTLGPGAKMGHVSYLGDAQVGANANIGAGTITCNYDGQRKHRTEIEADVFIGSDSLLIAPVHIGEGAKTGAGSVVTHDVPPRTLVYGVPARPHKDLTREDAAEDTTSEA
jgi:bifunctional UDP-N-acetylglucosamine pyrophosphorylase/glucosamine-1-phosphate N-acetyltransferase